jgi:hypothetical protein
MLLSPGRRAEALRAVTWLASQAQGALEEKRSPFFSGGKRVHVVNSLIRGNLQGIF